MKPFLYLCASALSASLLLNTFAEACSRVLYQGGNDTTITGRSMDWSEDMQTNLWVFPQGIPRSGGNQADAAKWTSKYGSVVASIYGLASVDGMNEKGLVMNMLYLAESDYGKAMPKQATLPISLWGQYVLDNYATVAETVAGLQEKAFHIESFDLPNGAPAQAHLSISDASGDSAIFEYVGGQLTIHHGKQYTVMTNSPIYSKQLALNEYWEDIGGTVFLPGTSRAADRFARASFFLQTIPKTLDSRYIKAVPTQQYAVQAIASVLSVVRSVSVPLGINTPNQPNIASTIWRTVADHKHRAYFYDSATSPNAFWVSLDKLNFKAGAPVLKLSLDAGQVYDGEASAAFKPAQPFIFLTDTSPVAATPDASKSEATKVPPNSSKAP